MLRYEQSKLLQIQFFEKFFPKYVLGTAGCPRLTALRIITFSRVSGRSCKPLERSSGNLRQRRSQMVGCCVIFRHVHSAEPPPHRPDEHPHFLRYATELAAALRHTIFVDRVVYHFTSRTEVLELLEEHITENIVKVQYSYNWNLE